LPAEIGGRKVRSKRGRIEVRLAGFCCNITLEFSRLARSKAIRIAVPIATCRRDNTVANTTAQL
jgi:hypothetical protein